MSTPVFETADSLIDGSSRAQWRDVAHALIRPSMTSIVVCLATAAAIVGGVMILSASTVCGIVEWHAVHSFKQRDEAAYVSCKALALQKTQLSERGLIFLGASTTRESFDEARLVQLLTPSGGVRIHNFTSSAQHVLESIALSDAIPTHFKGMVLIGINPGRVGKKIDTDAIFQKPEIGFTSSSLTAEAKYWSAPEPPRPSGFYAWDHRYYIARLWGNIADDLPRILRGRRASQVPTRHFYLNQPAQKESKLAAQFAQVAAAWATYDEVAKGNLAAYERLIRRLRAQGVDVALVEAPINPAFIEVYGTEQYARHIDIMKAFAERTGVRYWNIPAELKLGSEDFFDWGHLRTAAAQNAYSAALAAHVGRELKRASP